MISHKQLTIAVIVFILVISSLSVYSDDASKKNVCLNPKSLNYCTSDENGEYNSYTIDDTGQCCNAKGDITRNDIGGDIKSEINSLIPDPTQSCKLISITGTNYEYIVPNVELSLSTDPCIASKNVGVCCDASNNQNAQKKFGCIANGNKWIDGANAQCTEPVRGGNTDGQRTTINIGQTCNDGNGCICNGQNINNDAQCQSSPPSPDSCMSITSLTSCTETTGCLWHSLGAGSGKCKTGNTCQLPDWKSGGTKICIRATITGGTGTPPPTSSLRCGATNLEITLNEVKAVAGQNQNKITWTIPTASTEPQLTIFHIYRCDKNLFDTETKCTNPEYNANKRLITSIPITTQNSGQFNYIDSGILLAEKDDSINEKYYYSVAADFSGRIIETPPQEIFRPDKSCIGKETGKSYCLNENNKFSCENNQVSPDSIGESCITTTTGKCIEPSIGNAVCAGSDSCITTTIDSNTIETLSNPLNLYIESVNLANKKLFLELSSTIVNKCKECSTIRECTSYTTASSCASDPCGIGTIGATKNCLWKPINTALDSFGIGVCINKEKDNCASCGSLAAINPIFGTCTQEMATALSTTDYTCTLKTIPGQPATASSNAQIETPTTIVTLPPTIQQGIGDILFTPDRTATTTFCIDQSGRCNPSCQITSNPKKITLNGFDNSGHIISSPNCQTNSIKLKTGINYLKFFSQTTNNKEPDKTIQFYVGETTSSLTASGTITKLELPADVKITIQSTIPVKCTFDSTCKLNLQVSSDAEVGKTLFPQTTGGCFANNYEVNYILQEGDYSFTACCQDSQGKSISLDGSLPINIHPGLEFISPKPNEKISTDVTEIKFKTKGDWDLCYIGDTENPTNIINNVQVVDGGVEYTYSLTPHLSQTKEYAYYIKCVGPAPDLTAQLKFTIDKEKPKVYLLNDEDVVLDTNNKFPKRTTFKITCKDSPPEQTTGSKINPETGFGCVQYQICESDCSSFGDFDSCECETTYIQKQGTEILPKTFQTKTKIFWKALGKEPGAEWNSGSYILDISEPQQIELSIDNTFTDDNGQKIIGTGTHTVTFTSDKQLRLAILRMGKDGAPFTPKVSDRTLFKANNGVVAQTTDITSDSWGQSFTLNIVKQSNNNIYVRVYSGTTTYFEETYKPSLSPQIIFRTETYDNDGNKDESTNTYVLDIHPPSITAISAVDIKPIPNTQNLYAFDGKTDLRIRIPFTSDISYALVKSKAPDGTETNLYALKLEGNLLSYKEGIGAYTPLPALTDISKAVFSITKDKLTSPRTEITVVPIDKVVNIGEPSNSLIILKDTISPTNDKYPPAISRNPIVIAPVNNKVPIKITIKDTAGTGEEESGIDEKSIRFSVCKVDLSEDTTLSECKTDFTLTNKVQKSETDARLISANIEKQLDITFAPEETIQKYKISLDFSDYAGNKYDGGTEKLKEWDFFVSNEIPAQPVFKIGATTLNLPPAENPINNPSQTITLDFASALSEANSKVKIISYQIDSGTPTQLNTILKNSGNLITLTITLPEPAENKVYELKIKAVKYLSTIGAKEIYGREGEYNVKLKIDQTPPAISSFTIKSTSSSIDYVSAGEGIDVSANIADASTVQLFLSKDDVNNAGDIAILNPTKSGNTYTWEILPTIFSSGTFNNYEGEIYPIIYAKDALGNEITQAGPKITRDAGAPTITISSPGASPVITDKITNLGRFIVEITDNGAGIDATKLENTCLKIYPENKDPFVSYNCLTLQIGVENTANNLILGYQFSSYGDKPDGKYTLEFTAKDKAGNQAPPQTITLEVDSKTIPTLPAISFKKDISPITLTKTITHGAEYENRLYYNKAEINKIVIDIKQTDNVLKTVSFDGNPVTPTLLANSQTKYEFSTGGTLGILGTKTYPIVVNVAKKLGSSEGTLKPFTYYLHIDTSTPELQINKVSKYDNDNTKKIETQLHPLQDSPDRYYTDLNIIKIESTFIDEQITNDVPDSLISPLITLTAKDATGNSYALSPPLKIDGTKLTFGIGLGALEGEKIINLEISDRAGNKQTKQLTFIYDKTGPLITILQSPTSTHGAQWTKETKSVTKWALSTGDEPNIDTYSIAITDKSTPEIDTATGKLKNELNLGAALDEIKSKKEFAYDFSTGSYGSSIKISAGESKTFYIHIRAKDKAGNWGSVSTHPINIDLKKPEIKSISPPKDSIISSDIAPLTIILDGTGSAINQVSIKLFINNIQKTYTYDAAQNKITFTPDAASKYFQLSQTSDGKNSITLQAEDMAGNILQEQWLFTVDSKVISPAKVILASSDGKQQVDIKSTIGFITFNMPDFKISFLKEIDTIDLFLDGRKITDVSEQPIYYLKGKNLGAELQSIFTPLNPSPPNPQFRDGHQYTLQINTTKDGSTGSETYRFTVDVTPPELDSATGLQIDGKLQGDTYISPNSDGIKDIATIKFKPIDTSGKINYQVDIIDGTLKKTIKGTADSGAETSLIFDGMSDDSKLMSNSEIKLTLTDLAGNSVDFPKRNILIDTTKPEFKTLTTDKSTYKAGEKLTLNFEPNENIASYGITAGEINLPSNICTQLSGTNQYKCEHNIPADGYEGTKDIILSITDLAGNTNAGKKTILVDGQPPRIANLKPSTYNNGKNTILSAEIYDSDLDPSSVTFKFNGNSLQGIQQQGNTFSYTFTSDLEEKEHAVEITASDRSGNTATASWRFTVNQNYPPEPIITIDSAKTFEGIQYSRQKNSIITIEYQSLDDIILSKATISSQQITCNPIPNIKNKWTCTPNTNILPDESESILTLEAYKTGFSSLIGTYQFTFITDVKQPQLQVTPLSIKISEVPLTGISLSYKYSDKYMSRIEFTGNIQTKITQPLPKSETLKDYSSNILPSTGDGIKLINITAFDRAGNNITILAQTKIDTLPPADAAIQVKDSANNILLNENGVWKTKSTGKFTISGQLSQNEDDRIEVFIDGNEAAKREFTLPQIDITKENEETTITIILRDKDNTNLIHRQQIKIFIDKKAPVITLATPAGGFTKLRRNIPLTITTDENAKCTLTYTLQSPQIIDLSQTQYQKAFTHTIPYIVSDLLPISAECSDTFENKFTQQFTIRIDEDAPAISLVTVNDAVETAPKEFIIVKAGNVAVPFLKVTSPEEVRCKYGTTTDESSMLIFPNYNNPDSSLAYRTSPESDLIDISSLEPNQPSTQYNILCEDKAGNKAVMYTIKIGYNPDYAIVITRVSPEEITNDRKPIIKVSTDIPALCTIDEKFGGFFGFIQDALTPSAPMIPTADSKTHQYPESLAKYKTPLEEKSEAYRFEIKCRDTSASRIKRKDGALNLAFIVDITNPSKPTITSPENNAYTNQARITVEGTTADSSTDIEIYADGSSDAKGNAVSSSTLTNGRYRFTVQNIPLSKGENKLYAKAKDVAGNSIDSDKLTISYISDAPEPTVLPQGTVRQASQITATFNVPRGITTELTNKKLTRHYLLNEQEIIEDIIIKSEKIHDNNFRITREDNKNLSNGTYALELTVTDNIGNIGTFSDNMFTVNSRVPRITITSPEGLQTSLYKTNDEILRITGVVTDEENEITDVTITYNGTIRKMTIPADKHNVPIITEPPLTLVKGADTIKINATAKVSDSLFNTAQETFTVILDKEVLGGEITIE